VGFVVGACSFGPQHWIRGGRCGGGGRECGGGDTGLACVDLSDEAYIAIDAAGKHDPPKILRARPHLQGLIWSKTI
jgi:hypothetical protein